MAPSTPHPPLTQPRPPGLTFPAHPVGGPVVSIEMGWPGGLHHQVLHVPPGEVLTAKEGGRAGAQSPRTEPGGPRLPCRGRWWGQGWPHAPATYLASRVRAMMPAARGAEAEVPVWDSVHFCRKSVVTCGRARCGVQGECRDPGGHLPARPLPTGPEHCRGRVSHGQDTQVPGLPC